MEKSWYQSKTIWGGGIFAITSFLAAGGWVPESLITEVVRWGSGLLGIVGARDALG
ncbi:MAG: hypothetical protein IH964_12175 [Candidatus Dadabacteria bacterium]|nr:hypothetical protein [Candidatus Dadabacteria bacterium]